MNQTAIPDWQLERFRLRELPPAEQNAVAEAVERSPALRARLEALERSDEQILAARSPRQVAGALLAGLDQPVDRPRTLERRLGLAGAAAAILAGLWTLVPRISDGPPGKAPSDEVTRIKGSQPRLLLFRRASAGPEVLREGAVVHARDVIQLSYVAAGRRYGVVVSIDGRGFVTRHLPSDGTRAAELDGRGPVTLASAFELDDAPAFERFFFVTSAEPFAASVVTEAAADLATRRAGQRLELPATLEQSTFLLRKDGRP